MVHADSLEIGVPGHLFTAMLRGGVARVRGDTAALHSAYRAFLENYDSEMESWPDGISRSRDIRSKRFSTKRAAEAAPPIRSTESLLMLTYVSACLCLSPGLANSAYFGVGAKGIFTP